MRCFIMLRVMNKIVNLQQKTQSLMIQKRQSERSNAQTPRSPTPVSPVKQKEEITCRICLEDMTMEETFLVCHCKQANGHVHERCLVQWARKAQKYRQSYSKYYYYCEICKQKIYLRVERKFNCLKWRQIQFGGEELCCTASSTTIFVLGLGMFVASLYLKVVSRHDEGSLFDVSLGAAIFIILLNLLISAIYFTIQTDIIVTGIVIKERLYAEKENERTGVKSNRVMETNEKFKEVQETVERDNFNVTEANFIEPNRQVLEGIQFQRSPQFMGRGDSVERRGNVFDSGEVQKGLDEERKVEIQCGDKGNEPVLVLNKNIDNSVDGGEHMMETKVTNFESSKMVSDKNTNLKDSSLVSVQEHTVSSIQVRSILCQSKEEYESNFRRLSQSFEPQNDFSLVQMEDQHEIGHNQIPQISKPVGMSRGVNLKKYRSTEPGLMGLKKTVSMQIDGCNDKSVQYQNQEIEIYYPKMEGKDQSSVKQ